MNARLLSGLATVVFGLAALAVCASPAPAQTGPAGHWAATFNPDGRDITLSLDLARNDKSEWIASMGVPSENATGLVVGDVAVSGSSVTFVAVELMMSKFELTLDAGGALKGTVMAGPKAMPIEFRRTGEAKVQLMPPSPAVSKELEGDWEGSLAMGNQTMPIVIHLKNRPDKTVAATMDSPARNAMAIPLNDVKQAGSNVEIGVRVAHARFRGALNSAGTELTGQWMHEEMTMPLTLRKK